MYKRSLIFTALALAIACECAPVLANDTTSDHVGNGIHDVTDSELSTMRGRYVAGDNTVLWFGVEMVSTWQTNSGQVLQSAMTLGLDFSKNPNQPQVTFVPTVTITTTNAPLPTSATQSTVNRSVQSGGIANVGGLTQSVQLAGDNNSASNVTRLNIQNGGNIPTLSSSNTTSSNNSSSSPTGASVTVTGDMVNANSSTTNLDSNSNSSNSNSVASTSTSSNTTPTTTTNTGVSTPTGRTATTGDATASATYSNNNAEVNLSVAGQGTATQWIRAGSLGQTIALTTDNQVVTNQMIVSMVTQSLASTSQLTRTLAQSINLSHFNSR